MSSIDKSKELEDALGIPVRKVEPSELPPEIVFVLNLLGVEAVDGIYTPDLSNDKD